MNEQQARDLYPAWTSESLRYSDTDSQGHVNNAVFATLLEAGRIATLFDEERSLLEPGTAIVVARLAIDFKAELTWPGTVEIGTRALRVGVSSVTLDQAMFQKGVCAATAETVIVLMDVETRKSRPLSPTAAAQLQALIVETPE